MKERTAASRLRPAGGRAGRRRCPAAWLGGLLALAALAAGCGPRASPPPVLPEVRIALLVVVEQLPRDLLERARPLLRGGLARMIDEGVELTAARHLHAVTTSSPGHATLATGTDPRHHGIVGERWFDRRAGRWVEAVEDPGGAGVSAARLLRPTIGDRLVAQVPGSRVYSVAGGSDGVLLGGRAATGAYWYAAEEGRFTGSPATSRGRAGWVEDFHGRRVVDRFFGETWQPLRLGERIAAAGTRRPDEGDFARRFPHPLGDATFLPDPAYYRGLADSPFLDRVTLEMVRTVVVEEGVGQGEGIDLLAVSFAALENVGRRFGPHGPEALDTLLRLDATLGELLAFLEARVGADGLVVALSSDHGVAPLPEALRPEEVPEGIVPTRRGASDVACLQRVGRSLAGSFPFSELVGADGYLSSEGRSGRVARRDDLLRAWQAEAERCPAVDRVWIGWALEQDAGSNPEALRQLRSWHPERSPDVVVQWRPYHVPEPGRGTTSGSVWDYDARVPMIFWGHGLPQARLDVPVGTVDLAPTLARLLGLRLPEVDGRDLTPLFLPGLPPAR